MYIQDEKKTEEYVPLDSLENQGTPFSYDHTK